MGLDSDTFSRLTEIVNNEMITSIVVNQGVLGCAIYELLQAENHGIQL